MVSSEAIISFLVFYKTRLLSALSIKELKLAINLIMRGKEDTQVLTLKQEKITMNAGEEG